MAHKSNV